MSLKSMTASLRTLLSGGKLKDLTMRPVGRAAVELDSKVGYSKITRKYVLEGVRVSKYCMEWAAYDDTKKYVTGEIVLHGDDYWECILHESQGVEPLPENNENWRPGAPVLIPIGTEDEEYKDHYLVDQKVMPGTTVDQAYIQRTFVEFRKNTWSSETVSEGGDLKRMNRKYVILRSKNDDIGYSDSTFIEEHPQFNQKLNTGVKTASIEPWPWIPNTIKNTEPVAILNYTPSDYYGNAGQYSTLGLEEPVLEGDTLYNKLTDGETYKPKWVRGPITVDMSNPGFDIWSVTWVAPVTPHWVAYGKSTSSYTKPRLPQVLTFSHHGVKLEPFGSGDASGNGSVWTYIWYYVGDMPTQDMIGLSKYPETPIVNFDFAFTGMGQNAQVIPFKRKYENTIWSRAFSTQNDDIMFPATNAWTYSAKDNLDVIVDPPETFEFANAWGKSTEFVQNYVAGQIPVEVGNGGTPSGLTMEGNSGVIIPVNQMGDSGFTSKFTNEIYFNFTYPLVTLGSASDYPGDFVGYRDKDGNMQSLGGSNQPLIPGYQGTPLSLTRGLINYSYDIDPTASYSAMIGYRVKPIFSHGNERIWKIEVSYAS